MKQISIQLNPNVEKSKLHEISGQYAARALVTFGPDAGSLAGKTLEFPVTNETGAFSVVFPRAGCMGQSLFRGDEAAVKGLTSEILTATEEAINGTRATIGAAPVTIARQCELDGGAALAALMAELEAEGAQASV